MSSEGRQQGHQKGRLGQGHFSGNLGKRTSFLPTSRVYSVWLIC